MQTGFHFSHEWKQQLSSAQQEGNSFNQGQQQVRHGDQP